MYIFAQFATGAGERLRKALQLQEKNVVNMLQFYGWGWKKKQNN
jgi:hypothetical protein